MEGEYDCSLASYTGLDGTWVNMHRYYLRYDWVKHNPKHSIARFLVLLVHKQDQKRLKVWEYQQREMRKALATSEGF